MELRIGKVSTVNYKTGMISVIYEEENNAVTAKMPCLSFNGEYKMPKADDYVAVAYLSNGSSIGLILGSFWNEKTSRSIRAKVFTIKKLHRMHIFTTTKTH